MSQIKVRKLDAARSQLETAVRLYFSNADPVSVHTLTAAAYRVLADINRKRGGKPMLKEAIIPAWVRPDLSNEAKRRLNEAENFFKHAERDHEKVLEFRESATELLLYDAIKKYQELTRESPPVLGVYESWFWFGPGAKFVTTAEHQKARDEVRRAFPNATRASFFAEVLPMLSSAI